MSRVKGNSNGREVEFTTIVVPEDVTARIACAALLVDAEQSAVNKASVNKYIAELAAKIV